jgi:hypothetical protein
MGKMYTGAQHYTRGNATAREWPFTLWHLGRYQTTSQPHIGPEMHNHTADEYDWAPAVAALHLHDMVTEQVARVLLPNFI